MAAKAYGKKVLLTLVYKGIPPGGRPLGLHRQILCLSPGSQLSSCILPVSPSVLGRPSSQCSLCSADDEAMATEVTPPANAELTELGKCLMKQEVRVCALTATTFSQ